jgi:hypothetical protein
MGTPRHVRFTPDSDRIADVAGGPVSCDCRASRMHPPKERSTLNALNWQRTSLNLHAMGRNWFICPNRRPVLSAFYKAKTWRVFPAVFSAVKGSSLRGLGHSSFMRAPKHRPAPRRSRGMVQAIAASRRRRGRLADKVPRRAERVGVVRRLHHAAELGTQPPECTIDVLIVLPVEVL